MEIAGAASALAAEGAIDDGAGCCANVIKLVENVAINKYRVVWRRMLRAIESSLRPIREAHCGSAPKNSLNICLDLATVVPFLLPRPFSSQ
jgi:hypothetical protein